MNNLLSNTIAFAVGAAVGSVLAWCYLKAKYEQLLEDDEEPVVSEPVDYRQVHTEYKDILQRNNYAEKEDDNMPKPYVISPEQVGDEDYDLISLNYYADGILTDDYGEPIVDIDDVVGLDSLDHFGEYENDTVFVRNDERHCDYEILAIAHNYDPETDLYSSDGYNG